MGYNGVKGEGDFGVGSAMPSERRASADDMLAVMGYAAELQRSRSTLQVAFMSFVLSAVPYGLATTLFYPLIGGGPVAVIWGWVAVCLIVLCVAISLGEITSVYPTAGGVYYQTYMLAPPAYRNITAWICGWAYTLGNMTITLSVNFGTTLFIIGCINIFTDDAGNGIWTATTWQTWLTFVAITLLCNAISALGNKWLPLLDVCVLSTSFHAALGSFVVVTIFLMHRSFFVCMQLPHCYPQKHWKLTRVFANFMLDLRHLLDLCRCLCHHYLCPCRRSRGPSQRQLCFWEFHSLVGLASRLVFLHWSPPRSLCYICHWHDSLVSADYTPRFAGTSTHNHAECVKKSANLQHKSRKLW